MKKKPTSKSCGNNVKGKGRPCKLTPQLIKEFKKVLRNTLFIETACCCVNIDRYSMKRWLKEGKEEYERLATDEKAVPNKKKQLYLDFFIAYRETLARADEEMGQLMQKHMKTSWQAIAWMRNSRWPERWGSDKKEIKELQKQLADIQKILAEKMKE